MEHANETMAQGGATSGQWKPPSKPTRTKKKLQANMKVCLELTVRDVY